jgi:hypothetical protein
MTVESQAGGEAMRPVRTIEELAVAAAVVLLLFTPMIDPIVSLVAAGVLLVVLVGAFAIDRRNHGRQA